jgi:hypothetical protein
MKFFLTLIVVICLGVVCGRAQSLPADQVRDTIRTVKHDVKKVSKNVSDTVIRDKTKRVSGAVKNEIKKDAGAVKNTPQHTIVKTKQKTEQNLKSVYTLPESKPINDKTLPEDGRVEVKKTAQQSVNDKGVQQLKEIKEDVKRDKAEVKTTAAGTVTEVKQTAAEEADLKKLSQAHHREKLEGKISTMEYNSEDPDNAPWKKKQFSKDDLNDLKNSTDLPGNFSGIENKPSRYGDKIKGLKSPGVSDKGITEQKEKLEQSSSKLQPRQNLGHRIDSIADVKDRLEVGNLKQELLGAKRIYSDKYIKKLCDSLGMGKADSILKVASVFAKIETPREELLNKINNSIAGKEIQGVGYDPEKQTLKTEKADQLNSLPEQIEKSKDLSRLKNGDISSLKLPQSVLSELPPLGGTLLDSKYMPVVDSMRRVALKAKRLELKEDKITDDLKRTAVKNKPKFLDKLYFEGVLGFVNDSTINIVQFSPSLGYHFTDFLSVGMGPTIAVQFQQKKLHAMAGFRSFIKMEVWKQRAYFQFEDNVDQVKLDNDSFKKQRHTLLAGAGVLLPITKKLALNLVVLHRLNKDIQMPGRSPWVVRVGFSSIKKIQK